MESYWISPRAPHPSRTLTEDSWERQHRAGHTWESAEQYLRSAWDRYSCYGAAGILYRDTIIRPLHDRFNAGERSLGLLCAIRAL